MITEKEIILKSEKKIKLSDLTDEQKMIYDAGYRGGKYEQRVVTIVTTLLGFLIYFLIYLFANFI